MGDASNSTISITKRGDREIVITRDFDAPRELVFKTLTDPKHIPNWWGPRRYTVKVDKMDVREGGAWRFLSTGPDGEDGFKGVYRDIKPPERIVQTFEWEGLPGHVAVDTLVLEDRDGKTRMTATSVFDTREDRDGMWETGAESGARETWERFGDLVDELQTRSEEGVRS